MMIISSKKSKGKGIQSFADEMEKMDMLNDPVQQINQRFKLIVSVILSILILDPDDRLSHVFI